MIQELQLTAHDKSEVLTACFFRGLEARQPIRQDNATGNQMTLRPGANRLRPEAIDDAHSHMDRMTLLIQGNGGDKGCLTGRTTAHGNIMKPRMSLLTRRQFTSIMLHNEYAPH